MRYRIDNEGYITEVFFNCYVGDCNEYIGTIPDDYETLLEWSENANIQAYKIVDGNLVYDENKDNELKRKFETETEENSTATHKWVCDKFGKINSVYDDELSVNIDGSSLFTLDNAKESEFVSLKLTPNEHITSDLMINISNENMLENKISTQTIGGVKFTVNNDKTITLNGTSTEAIELVLNGSLTSEDILFFLKSNTNYMKGGLPSNVGMNLYYYDGTDRELISSGTNGTLNYTDTKYITCVSLTIASGKTFKDVKVSPMLTIGEYEEKPYVEHKGNDLLIFDLGSYIFRNDDYILIERERLYFYTKVGLYPNINLKAGKNVFPTQERLEIINAIIDSLTSYEGLTIIQCDKDINFSIRYFTKDYLNERFASIQVEQDKIALEVSKKANATDLENAIEDLTSSITQTANSITSSVSATYSTKDDTTKAKNDAISSANTNTDNKLKNYSTTTEMNSSISQNISNVNNQINELEKETKASLELKIDKNDNNQIVSMINASADEVNIDGKKIALANFEITDDKLISDIIPEYDFTEDDMEKVKNYIMGTVTLTTEEIKKYDLTGNGTVDVLDWLKIQRAILSGISSTNPGRFELDTSPKSTEIIKFYNNENELLYYIGYMISKFNAINCDYLSTNTLDAGNIESGTCVLSYNSTTTITFSKTFSTPPNVVITPYTATSGVIAPKIRNITETGFEANIGGTEFKDITCCWIAIG